MPSFAFPWLRSALLALTVLCAGCQTSTRSLFTASGPEWRVQQGQAIWQPGRKYPELGGDIVLASDGTGRCLVQFAKTPMTLVSAQTTPMQWLIQFPPGQGQVLSPPKELPSAGPGKDATARPLAFKGRQPPPARFAWLYLYAALSGQPLPPAFHFERKPDGGWRLENTRSGETLDGFLSP
jgi:hypothetical protein